MSGPCDAPGGDLPTQLAGNAMREVIEDGWVGVPGLGLSGVNFRPPGLRRLVVGDRLVWKAEHLFSV